MPATELHDANDRTAAGTPVANLYCHGCGHYSGGGLCRVCQREKAKASAAIQSESK